jgi:cell division protease FtsH
MFVGVGAGRVRDMFRQAKKNAPCIVFIDELDAVGRQRGTGMGGGNDEREQTLNQLLVEMDGFSDNSGVIVIAATNRDDVLDPALLRAGRFDRKITVSLPDRKGRAAIFAVHARGKKISSLVDFDQLAKRTVGFSGADIESILNDAAILAVRLNKKEIDIYDIDEAIDRRIAGPARDSVGMNEKERRTVAYHEAGHAIIGIYNKNADKVQKITIIPRGRTGGHVLMTPEEDRFLLTKNELTARIIGYLAGRVSEEIFFDDVSTGAHNDIEMATRIARAMVTEYGMSSLGPIQYEKDTGSVFLGRDYTSVQKNFSQEVALAIDNEIRKIVSDAHDLARKTLLKHKEDLILIAETLLEKETINAEEIDYLLKHRSLDGFNSNAQKEQQKEVILTEEPPKEIKVEKEKPSKKGEKEEA